MRKRSGFTIVELLVVVSIIALLVGILLPAIGKARDQARLSISRTNLRQLGQGAATYASEWQDRQVTLVNENIGRYGNSMIDALGNFQQQNGMTHPGVVAGLGPGTHQDDRYTQVRVPPSPLPSLRGFSHSHAGSRRDRA